jgi:hypothetical protein
MITATVAGLPLDSGQVLATCTVIHGRRSFGEGGQPSSATITVEYPPGAMPVWQSGDTLELMSDDGPLFSGRIVSRNLTHTPDRGLFQMTAAGALAALGVRRVGDAPWPLETGTARATRILTAAAVPYKVVTHTDLWVLPRDVDAQPAAGLLDELTAATGAAVFDTPTGVVVYQPLQSRSRIRPWMWRDFTTETWDVTDPALTWDAAPPTVADWISTSSQMPVVLPADTVVWEPEWTSQEGAVINHVRIGYGVAEEEQDAVELEDSASILQHGRRYLYEGTPLATAGDATTRATRILTTQAAERWEIGDVQVSLADLPGGLRAEVVGLLCGDQVVLQGMPQPAPAIDWSAILEGWTYTHTGSGGTVVEQMSLALSDPLLSLMVMVWNDYPALFVWPDHGTLFWSDLDDVDILEAA